MTSPGFDAQAKAAEALRRAADALEDYAVSETQAELAELMALHILRVVGSGNSAREAVLLMRALDRVG